MQFLAFAELVSFKSYSLLGIIYKRWYNKKYCFSNQRWAVRKYQIRNFSDFNSFKELRGFCKRGNLRICDFVNHIFL